MSSASHSPASRVLVDLNTQCDFLLPKGALPVWNRKDILPNIRKLMSWARTTRVPVISSLEAHRAGESRKGLPPHCVDRTNGQKKLPFTLLPKRLILMGDNTIDVPFQIFRRFQQVIFTKRDRDFLNNPKADRLVNNIEVNHMIVFGVVTEYCVKAAVLGLMTRRHRVVVVSDACGYWSSSDHDLALRQMDAKGAVLVTTDELVNGVADERIRAARRPMPIIEEEPVDELALLTCGEGHHPSNGNGNGYSHGNGRSHSKSNGEGEDHLVNPALLREALSRKGLSRAQPN